MSQVVFKKLFFLSYLTLGLFNKPYLISQPIISQNVEKESKITNTSFITKAIKRTGASVVTIETQRIVKNKNFSRDSRIFIDPYFEKVDFITKIDLLNPFFFAICVPNYDWLSVIMD